VAGQEDTADRITEVDKALETFRESFRADGYEIHVASVVGNRIELKIEAREGACEDCLVPEALMVPMVAASLPPELRSAQIHIAYPGD
jgi:hypothetical protein